MAIHRAAPLLLLIASLLLAVALSGADARTTVLHDKTLQAVIPDANDADNLPGLAKTDAAVVADPDCGDEDPDHPNKKPKHKKKHHKHSPPPHHAPASVESPRAPADTTESPRPATDSVEQVLCDGCEEPPKTPEPPCNSCEEPKEPGLTCNKAHAVRDGETCYSMWQCAGLGQDDFMRFNPNVCCDNLFVGQWVCLEATCAA